MLLLESIPKGNCVECLICACHFNIVVQQRMKYFSKNTELALCQPFLYRTCKRQTRHTFSNVMLCSRALRMGTALFLWQQRGNLKQGHINWPRYCNHVHKGQYPAWEDVCLLGGHTNYCVSAQASISVHQRLAGHWPVIIRWIYPVTFASAFIRPSIRWHPPLPSTALEPEDGWASLLVTVTDLT